MRGLFLFAFVLLLLSPVFAMEFDFVTSAELLLQVSGNFTIMKEEDARLYDLNFTSYVVPQDAEIVNYTCTNCGLSFAPDGIKVVKGSFSDESEFFVWEFTALVRKKREMTYLDPLPKFPYAKGFPVNVYPFTLFGELSDSNQAVCEKANELASGSPDYMNVIQRLGTWVHNNIEYNLAYSGERSASEVFEQRVGVCGAFSNLMISMLRCVGIPAKYVGGYAYGGEEERSFQGHAWVEAWVPDTGWVGFDPTYGQLGFVDASHLKFAEANDSSNYPSLVGMIYSKVGDVSAEEPEVGVSVSLVSTVEEKEPKIIADLQASKERAAKNDYIALTLFANSSKIVPLSLFVVSTENMSFVRNDSVVGVVVKQGFRYDWIVKTPDIELPKNQYQIHPIEVTLPLVFEKLNVSVSVYSDAVATGLSEVEKMVRLETEEVFDLDYVFSCDELVYEGMFAPFLEVLNTGNMPLSVLVKISSGEYSNETCLRLLLSQREEIPVSLDLPFGSHNVSLEITFSNETRGEVVRVLSLAKPKARMSLSYPNRTKGGVFGVVEVFTEGDIVDIKLKVSVGGETLFFDVENGAGSFEIPEELLEMGDNDVSFILEYEDFYGTVFSFEEEAGIEKYTTNIFQIIIDFLIEFLSSLFG